MAAEQSDKLIIVEQVYHQPVDSPAIVVETRSSRELVSCEQVYERRLAAAEEWTELELGWIATPGLLVIKNLASFFPQKIPTESEKQEAAKKILLVQYRGDSRGWLIHPGESMRAVPSPGDTPIILRSLCGITNYSVHVFPA